MDEDKRRAERKRTFIAGRMRFGRGALSSPCTVREMSDTGARITFEPGVTLPQTFTLEIPGRDFTREVELRWRHGESAGVAFIPAEQPEPVDAETRIRQLEEENAKLRIQVRELRREIAERRARDEASN